MLVVNHICFATKNKFDCHRVLSPKKCLNERGFLEHANKFDKRLQRKGVQTFYWMTSKQRLEVTNTANIYAQAPFDLGEKTLPQRNFMSFWEKHGCVNDLCIHPHSNRLTKIVGRKCWIMYFSQVDFLLSSYSCQL